MKQTSQEVLILNEKPPVFDRVVDLFGEVPVRRAIFTYGDKIYNPNGLVVPDEIVEHEKVHMRQQGHGDESAAKWWQAYLEDPQFRIEQEAEAYARQYVAMCRRLKGRTEQFNYLKEVAGALSGPLYGFQIDLMTAIHLIQRLSKL